VVGVGVAVAVAVGVAVAVAAALALAAGLWQTARPALGAELRQSAGAAARWVRVVGGAGQLAAVAGG
jgi:hypothetical protein